MGKKFDKIKLICETKSNLFIGGMNETFEIGGIDMYTVTREGKPYIPGSSLKGVFRNMFRNVYGNNTEECNEIKLIVSKYLTAEIKKIKEVETEIEKSEEEEERKNNVKEKLSKSKDFLEKLKNDINIESIFGISGLNNHPRLVFSDFDVMDNENDEYFSIDIKNKITIDGNEISSDPRIYKAVKKGVKFSGCISLMKFLEEDRKKIYSIILDSLKYFNNGNYRLGNSQSRGYGIVEFEVDLNGDK
jgi:CRISPR-associated protein Csm3